MNRLSRLVRVTQLSLGPDLFFITRTRHQPLLLTARPDTLLKWRQISNSAISQMVRIVEVKTEEGGERPRNSGVEYLDSKKRRTLPKELLKNVVVLTCESDDGGTCDVYVVGTCHVSQESCREVQAVISHLRPQVVFLELCESREGHLRPISLKDIKVSTMSEVTDQLMRKQNPFRIWLDHSFERAAAEHKVVPGSEFRVAYEEAKKWGSKVVLGDRPMNITLERMRASWGKLSLWLKARASIKKVLNTVWEETMVDERDRYMSTTLLVVASLHPSVLAVPSRHRSVVAVVGKDHLPGIKKYWMQPVELEKLMEIPSTNRKIAKSLGFAAVGVAIVAGVYLAARK